MIKLGIVGYGGMGHWHCEQAQGLDGVEVTAVCDTNPGRFDNTDALGIRAYGDYRELLTDPEVNTVLVSTPNHLHCEVAVAASNAKKHVIAEKPAAMNVAELDRMIAAAKDNGVLFTVHQNRRWDVDYRTAKEVLDSGSLGEVFTIESRLYGVNGRVHDWHVFKKYGGGMIYDWGPHLVDQMLQMVPGKLLTVYADVRSIINDEVDDYFKLVFKFECGVAFRIELGTYMLHPMPRWYIAGNKGTLIVNGFGMACDGKIIRTTKLQDKIPAKIAATLQGPTRSFEPPAEGVVYSEPLPKVTGGWEAYYRNLVQVLDGKAELAVKSEEARRVLSVLEAVSESAESGKTVDFNA